MSTAVMTETKSAEGVAARLAKSLSAEKFDDAVHASKQAMKAVRRRAEDLADLRYDVAHQVRRAPFKALGLALGLGIVVGTVTGLVMRRRVRG